MQSNDIFPLLLSGSGTASENKNDPKSKQAVYVYNRDDRGVRLMMIFSVLRLLFFNINAFIHFHPK